MNQESREAIIELLFLSLYLDNHLSMAEDKVLETALHTLGWESPRPKEIFLLNAFARARAASSCESEQEAFLAARATTIQASGDATTALEWLGRVLGSDGLSEPETRFLARLQQIWSIDK